ncbi:MAG: glucosamine-6-phosphate deaminase [Bacteroidales bacterium]|nr:glucosamine-6-phosphate deaminase [Bacteroidales bacterium]
MRIFPTEQAFDEAAARCIYDCIGAKKNVVVGLSTGRTTKNMHNILARMLCDRPLDLSEVTFFGQDEIGGVPREYWGACYTMLKTELLDALPLREDQFLMLPTASDDYRRDCQAFTAELERRGGVDLLVLGLGENGHLGFNQPGTPFGSTAWASTLSPELDARVRKDLSLGADASLCGVTMGLKDVMHARRLLLVAKGDHKAAMVKEILQGPVTEAVPASILQLHPSCEYYLDARAASLL